MNFDPQVRVRFLRIKSAALVLLAGIATAVPTLSARSQIADVVIENVAAKIDGYGEFTIKSAVFEGTNLSKDEIVGFLSGALTGEEAAAVLKRLTAAKISIPETKATVTTGIGDTTAELLIRGYVATGVVSGRVANITVGSTDAVIRLDAGPVVVRSGPISVTDSDFNPALRMIGKADFSNLNVQKYSKLTSAGFEATIPLPASFKGNAGDQPVTLSMGAAYDLNRFNGDVPSGGESALNSFRLAFPQGSVIGDALSKFGYEEIVGDMSATWAYDLDAKRMDMRDMRVGFPGVGIMIFDMTLGNLSTEAVINGGEHQQDAVLDGVFLNFRAKFTDGGLLGKTLTFAAAKEGKAQDALTREWAGAVRGALPLVLGGDAGAQSVADAISDFLLNRGSVTFDVKAKGDGIPFRDLALVRNPLALLSVVDLSATANR